MANTYVRIYLHLVFAVKNRDAALAPHHRPEIFSYIAGIINGQGHKTYAIGGTENHVHALISYNPVQPLPDLLRDIKANSSKFINTNGFLKCRFAWQRGYAALSYSHSQIDAVIKYINSQPEHHNNMTLKEEIKMMLSRYNIDYEEEYLFDDV